MKGERRKTRLFRDKPGGSMPIFEGWCTSEVLQSARQCAEYTGAHLKCPCTNACSTLAISAEVGDGDPCGSKDGSVVDVLETTEAPENSHIVLAWVTDLL